MAKKKTTGTIQVQVADGMSGLAIPSGVTLLDLACTDTLDGFCTAGHSVNIIGDRNSGKTALAIASMAETFKRHGNQFGYDFYDVENAFSFDTAALFGDKFAKALNVIPVPLEEDWCTEALAQKMIDSMEKGPRFIVIDSMDAMRPRKEFDNTDDILKGKRGIDPRAVANNYMFRAIIPKIAQSGSFLIYLSQSRDHIGFGSSFMNLKTRSGGKALGYYAYVELWLSVGTAIKVGDIKIGNWVVGRIERSKANGKSKRVAKFPIMPAYGIDDVQANVEWLAEQGVIDCIRKVYDLAGLDMEYKGKEPCLHIESNNLTGKLTEAVKAQWDKVEQEMIDKTFGGRKPRYT